MCKKNNIFTTVEIPRVLYWMLLCNTIVLIVLVVVLDIFNA